MSRKADDKDVCVIKNEAVERFPKCIEGGVPESPAVPGGFVVLTSLISGQKRVKRVVETSSSSGPVQIEETQVERRQCPSRCFT